MSRLRSGFRGQERQLAHSLRAVPLLRAVPAADLVAIWRRLHELQVERGTIVCERGEPGDRFYMVHAGSLEVRLGLGPSGIAIRRLAAGDYFGELSLLSGAPRTADVVAAEDSLLWSLERQDFAALLAGRRSLLVAMNGALCERVMQLTAQLEERAAGLGDTVTGMRFGPYQVIEQLGAGGMAAVYSAIHVATQTAAAVKVLPAAWGEVPDLRARLVREAEALQAIDHPAVIQVLEVGGVEPRLGGGCYLALEWIPHALDRVMRAHFPEPLPISMSLRIAQHVAEGLAAVHAAGLIHRDVKPSNILLRADGTPVLTDLGLVAALSATAQAQRLTPADTILGTADYISPEQVAGTAVDGRSDLYSLGVVLYEMIVGYVPFAGRTPLEAARAHLEERPPPLPAATPREVCMLVERALQKRPEDRFPAASSMAEAIAALCAALEAEAGAEAGTAHTAARGNRDAPLDGRG